MSAIHKTEINIAHLPTKSVTFAPTRATVTREFEAIKTQIGANEIIITGLDRQIDPDSVRVDGQGLATITDTRAEVVRRKDRFEDQFPEHEEEEKEDEEDDDTDDALAALSDDAYGVDKNPVEDARRELQSAETVLANFKNSQDTSAKVLQFLDYYGQNIKPQEVDVAKMSDFLTMYRSQRASESETRQQAIIEIPLWEKKVANARDKLTRAETAFNKAKEAASREARREHDKKSRKKQQKRLEKQRINEERFKFWSEFTGQVVVSLDRVAAYTPNSSRRGSLTSAAEGSVDSAAFKPLDEDCVNLRLTYVVPNASWVPRYELKINTPKSSAELVYRAEFENRTSETWKNAKITFSTSLTSFSGLDDKIPVLEPWHIKLQGSASGLEIENGISTSSLRSKNEILANTSQTNKDMGIRKLARRHPGSVLSVKDMLQEPQQQPQPQQQQQQQMLRSRLPPLPPPARQAEFPPALAAAQAAAYPIPARAPIIGRSRLSLSVSGAPSAASSGSVFGRAVPGLADAHVATTRDRQEDSDSGDEAGDVRTINPEEYLIAHQDSTRQDYGLTTTYDLPGQRTLEPSVVKRRHVVAELRFPSITLSYVLIPKLRCAAFLKARIPNTTSISILRGKAGMTIDGTFLGSTVLPKCEPGEFLDLSLGVDPSILVTYAKPTARRSTTGFFSKEDSAVFTRSCWIKNTRKNEISITVFDQVPVSEDEQLRIHILEPKGLSQEDSTVKLDGLFKDGENGSGDVVLGKNGEIKWNIKLRPGKDVKLVLEYESRIPSGQHFVGLD